MSMARSRDYRAEYQRRIAGAFARGLSRSQARGHARSGEVPIRAKPIKSDARLEAALKLLNRTGLQGVAAKEAGVSPERFRRFLRENNLAERRGKRWQITDARLREMLVLSEGEAEFRLLPGFEPASLNGQYLNAVQKAVDRGEPEHLAPFEGRGVHDASGQLHLFETDLNALYRLFAAGSEVFEQVYRFVI
jgi:hypothetical protein